MYDNNIKRSFDVFIKHKTSRCISTDGRGSRFLRFFPLGDKTVSWSYGCCESRLSRNKKKHCFPSLPPPTLVLPSRTCFLGIWVPIRVAIGYVSSAIVKAAYSVLTLIDNLHTMHVKIGASKSGVLFSHFLSRSVSLSYAFCYFFFFLSFHPHRICCLETAINFKSTTPPLLSDFTRNVERKLQ